MIINTKLINIPPYISTTWRQVESLHIKETHEALTTLIVTLKSGLAVEVPGLTRTTIEEIFRAHSSFLENEESAPSQKDSLQNDLQNVLNLEGVESFGFPLKMNLEGMGSIGSMMQHNPEQSNSPNLPPEILQKISSIAHGLGIDEKNHHLPKPEPHCNCLYCQIVRAISGEIKQEEDAPSSEEEIVSDEDLNFRDWDITSITEKLYNVINPLDAAEHYQVYLGDPIGCTCGQKNCEHIKAVLKS